ncbi:uncharacterized protein LOC129595992 [Paramacrobiotus metropolitanus]|uniref:uncharacterized protein LOC129595992 n=1 Tax=Paramacrobiotus metropolitanus TaxID=2943436 RepID=UPI0024457DD3|nr:uncharacterized protein LOC129595992 [Paramacrobiotus metropolitanus]
MLKQTANMQSSNWIGHFIKITAALTAVFILCETVLYLTNPNNRWTLVANTSLKDGISNSLVYPAYAVDVAFQDVEEYPLTEPLIVNPLPNIINDVVLPQNDTFLPVHLVRFYFGLPHGDSHSFCWIDCISILSIMLYVKPSKIYIHTNYPDYWPFGRCDMITDWSLIQLVYTRQRFHLSGRRITFYKHEADVTKYSVAYQYGGIVQDSDVFHLPKMVELLRDWKNKKYQCLLTREDHFMNSGFIACPKGHPYTHDVLLRYRDDYRDPPVLYNSADVPWEIYNKNKDYQKNFFVDYQMGNHSWDYKGPIRYKEIPAWHAYWHGCDENEKNTVQLAKNSTYWEMLHFILAEGRKALIAVFPTTVKP